MQQVIGLSITTFVYLLTLFSGRWAMSAWYDRAGRNTAWYCAGAVSDDVRYRVSLEMSLMWERSMITGHRRRPGFLQSLDVLVFIS